MGDYSAHVLDRARQEIGQHREHTSGLVLEATRLSGSVGFLAGKAFLVYISNVYDNLPTDEVASIRGRNYLVEVRSYLPAADADAIAARFGLPHDQLPALATRLLRIGPELLRASLPGQFPAPRPPLLFSQPTLPAPRQRGCVQPRLEPLQAPPGLPREATHGPGRGLTPRILSGLPAMFLPTTVVGSYSLLRVVGEVRPQPPFGVGDVHAAPAGVVL